MKRTLFCFFVLFFFSLTVSAQIKVDKIIKNTQKKTERKVENRINNRIDRGIDKSLDKVEDGIDDAVKGDDSKSKSDKKSKSKSEESKSTGKKENEKGNSSQKQSAEEKNKQKPILQDSVKPSPVLQWAKYDFVPGTEIIFEDNQEGEQNGEFPSKWDLVEGTFENANFDGENVIYNIKCNMNGGGGIVPMMKNSNEDYLPEEFTIEFNVYFDEAHDRSYHLYLIDLKNQMKLDKAVPYSSKWLRIYKNSVDGKGIEHSYYPGFNNANFDKTPKWRHVAISFNKRALKVYLDDVRILNIPNLGYNPTGFSIGYQNVDGKRKGYIKNVCIAKGAVPLYDKFLTDGKFVTTGIKFDVNKATIKPESMGTINYVVKIMQEHPELNFSVEGHTDSDGDDASNLKLSEARAKSVLDQMVKLGIDKSRLTNKGLGESKPMAGNDTPEGKSQNRRVEFVKF